MNRNNELEKLSLKSESDNLYSHLIAFELIERTRKRMMYCQNSVSVTGGTYRTKKIITSFTIFIHHSIDLILNISRENT